MYFPSKPVTYRHPGENLSAGCIHREETWFFSPLSLSTQLPLCSEISTITCEHQQAVRGQGKTG